MSRPNGAIDLDRLRRQLVLFGKKRGEIHMSELRSFLPPEIVPPSELPAWRDALVAEGVAVRDGDEPPRVRPGTARLPVEADVE
jgi:RNA polymerase primary sigma factor